VKTTATTTTPTTSTVISYPRRSRSSCLCPY